MKFKALLLDIDNTLYDYNTTHNIAKKSVVEFCKNKFKLLFISYQYEFFILIQNKGNHHDPPIFMHHYC